MPIGVVTFIAAHKFYVRVKRFSTLILLMFKLVKQFCRADQQKSMEVVFFFAACEILCMCVRWIFFFRIL